MRSGAPALLATPGGVRIEVHGVNGNGPELRNAPADQEYGRGLLLVDALTVWRWGVSEREGVGKRVWVVVTNDDPTTPAVSSTAPPGAVGKRHEVLRTVDTSCAGQLGVPGRWLQPRSAGAFAPRHWPHEWHGYGTALELD
jgi:hypothetical protein